MKKIAVIAVIMLVALFVVSPRFERGFLAEDVGNNIGKKFYVVHPQIIVFSGVTNYPPIMFTKDGDKGKAEFFLVVYKEDMGVAAFLSDRELKITENEYVPMWVKEMTISVIDKLINDRVQSAKIAIKELAREQELQRGSQNGKKLSLPENKGRKIKI